MAAVMKCVECGHAIRAEDESPRTCPMCEGKMAAAKPKPAATAAIVDKAKPKPKPVDEEEKPKKAKAKPVEDEEDEEEEAPKPRPKAKRKEEPLPIADEENEEEETEDAFARDGGPAKQLGLDPGFKDRELMKQAAKELKGDETLYWVGRQSLPVVKKHALMTALGGLFFTLIVTGVLVFMLMDTKMHIPGFMAIVPGLMIVVGLSIAVLGPVLKLRQAKYGWYALTNRRAIVFQVYPIGKNGMATNYTSNQLRNTRLMKSFWKAGAGSLVFKTTITVTTRTTTNRRTGMSSTSRSKQITHYGFLYIEDYEDVGTLLREVIFGGARRRKKDEEEEEEEE